MTTPPVAPVLPTIAMAPLSPTTSTRTRPPVLSAAPQRKPRPGAKNAPAAGPSGAVPPWSLLGLVVQEVLR